MPEVMLSKRGTLGQWVTRNFGPIAVGSSGNCGIAHPPDTRAEANELIWWVLRTLPTDLRTRRSHGGRKEADMYLIKRLSVAALSLVALALAVGASWRLH